MSCMTSEITTGHWVVCAVYVYEANDDVDDAARSPVSWRCHRGTKCGKMESRQRKALALRSEFSLAVFHYVCKSLLGSGDLSTDFWFLKLTSPASTGDAICAKPWRHSNVLRRHSCCLPGGCWWCVVADDGRMWVSRHRLTFGWKKNYCCE
jgi:hypothetical protein